MAVNVVVGLQWGDEGKGKIVDYLAKEHDIVARFSGGANACHTVVHNGTEVQLSLVPSGVKNEHTQLIIADGTTVDPFRLVKEILLLQKKIDFDVNRLMIGQLTSITLPYHIYFDRANDEMASQLIPIGTTGSGIGPTQMDFVGRQGIRMFEFIDMKFMQEKIRKRITQQSTFSPLVSRLWGMVIPNGDFDQLEDILSIIKPRVINTSRFLNEAISKKKRILFEGAQGTLLDVRYGYYPFVTSAHTIAGAVSTGAGIGPTQINVVIGVMKAYSTRVSFGPFLTQLSGSAQDHIRTRGNEYLHESDVPLRVGWLDLVALRYAVQLNKPDYIALTKVDALSDLDEVNICIAYRRNGEVYYESPASLNDTEFEPIYKSFPGWKSSKYLFTEDNLPKNLLNYIEFIESEIQTPIKIISFGRNRKETIVR